MEALDFDLKLITPAFLAGAMEIEAQTHLRSRDGKIPRHRIIGPDGDGLRIPSLRGVLRFWFRAMEGLGDTALLARRESAVFGGPDSGQGLRIVPAGQSIWQPQEVRDRTKGAETYLGYGPLQIVQGRGTSHHKLAFRDAIPAGTVFSFRAIGRESQLHQLRRCLVLLHLFGGLGARSRRGWGSVAVVGEWIPTRQREETFETWFARCMALVWPKSEDRPSQRLVEPRYSAFWKNTSIHHFNAVPAEDDSKVPLFTHEQVFAQFFAAFSGARLYKPSARGTRSKIAVDDHKTESDALRNRKLAKSPLRLAFGFPYNVRFSDRTTLTFTAWRRGGSATEITRRSSPLLLKVIEEAPGRYAGMGLLLKSAFFSSSSTMIEAKEAAGRVPPPNYSAVEAFLLQKPWQVLPLP
jgi:CRISPR-associated protein Cmr1